MGEIISVTCKNCSYEDELLYGAGFGGVNHFYYGRKRFTSKSHQRVIPFIWKIKELEELNLMEESNSVFVLKELVKCPRCKQITLKVKEVGLWD